jgi:hypothetical protein
MTRELVYCLYPAIVHEGRVSGVIAKSRVARFGFKGSGALPCGEDTILSSLLGFLMKFQFHAVLLQSTYNISNFSSYSDSQPNLVKYVKTLTVISECVFWYEFVVIWQTIFLSRYILLEQIWLYLRNSIVPLCVRICVWSFKCQTCVFIIVQVWCECPAMAMLPWSRWSVYSLQCWPNRYGRRPRAAPRYYIVHSGNCDISWTVLTPCPSLFCATYVGGRSDDRSQI